MCICCKFDDPNYEGGANRVSLKQGQENFLKFGACEEKMIKYVRRPHKNDIRDNNWKLL
ncbi:CPCC family cysteine-rich protein [Alkaliphilus oremlandii]|uniref:CPCC family cysteine-rich protein n=1 Tax=Alkaliphilus oremlandii TaxID=461876 RepID=UPI0009FFE79E